MWMDVSYTRQKRFLLYLFYDNFILVGCTYKRYIHNCSIAFKEGRSRTFGVRGKVLRNWLNFDYRHFVDESAG